MGTRMVCFASRQARFTGTLCPPASRNGAWLGGCGAGDTRLQGEKKKKNSRFPSPGTMAGSSGASPGTGGWLVSQSIDKAGRRLVGDGQTLVPHKVCGRGVQWFWGPSGQWPQRLHVRNVELATERPGPWPA